MEFESELDSIQGGKYKMNRNSCNLNFFFEKIIAYRTFDTIF